jgi:D-arabinose 5-phosphate isomerase GutQ
MFFQLILYFLQKEIEMKRIIKIATTNPDIEPFIKRALSIHLGIITTLERNAKKVNNTVIELAKCMGDRGNIHIYAAGRSLRAAILAANRLCHGGANVSLMNGELPLKNTSWGGTAVCASASGKTLDVLQAMSIAKVSGMKIIGIANKNASKFEALCDIFIGIHTPLQNPLSALADTEEMIIAEILDAMVVMAGKKLGYTNLRWQLGHENSGATGITHYRRL